MIEVERVFGMAASWVAPATVLGALAVGFAVGLGPAFLVLAGGILLGAVILLWSSLGRLTGESPLTLEEAVGLAAPSAEEERKRAVVRALKDLDYERSVGKISEEDYADLSARYRAEAKALLQSLETGLSPLRKTVEQKLVSRLKSEGIDVVPKAASTGPRDGDEPVTPDPAASATSTEEPEAARAAPEEASPCTKCGTTNDVDASFCKRCGARLASGAS